MSGGRRGRSRCRTGCGRLGGGAPGGGTLADGRARPASMATGPRTTATGSAMRGRDRTVQRPVRPRAPDDDDAQRPRARDPAAGPAPMARPACRGRRRRGSRSHSDHSAGATTNEIAATDRRAAERDGERPPLPPDRRTTAGRRPRSPWSAARTTRPTDGGTRATMAAASSRWMLPWYSSSATGRERAAGRGSSRPPSQMTVAT